MVSRCLCRRRADCRGLAPWPTDGRPWSEMHLQRTHGVQHQCNQVHLPPNMHYKSKTALTLRLLHSAEQTVKPEAICSGPANEVHLDVTPHSAADFPAVSAEALHSADEDLADGIPLEPAAAAATCSVAEHLDDCGGYVSIAASPRAGGTLSIPDASKGQPPALAMSGGDGSAPVCCSVRRPQHCMSEATCSNEKPRGILLTCRQHYTCERCLGMPEFRCAHR